LGSTVETGRCRKCCRSDYYCCDRPLKANEQARFERISQLFCANKSPDEATGILIEKDSWHPQATANCVARWYGELTEGQGYAPNKSKRSARKSKKRRLSGLDKLLNRRPPAPKEKPWAILTTRYGDHKKSPTPGDMSAALDELYHENISYMTPADYAEHPNACMRCGFKDGTMYVLDLHRTGRALFQQWTDHDFENKLTDDIEIENVTEDKAKRLSDWLMDGNIDEIKAELSPVD
jgi:hypothetical protein